MIKGAVEALKQVGSSFKLEPFATIIQPIIEDVLAEHKKDKYRKGTILTPLIMVWLVLSLTLRRDISYPKTLNWLVSGVRWVCLDLPAKLVKDGAISHARVKLGVAVFRDIFYKFVLSLTNTVRHEYCLSNCNHLILLHSRKTILKKHFICQIYLFLII